LGGVILFTIRRTMMKKLLLIVSMCVVGVGTGFAIDFDLGSNQWWDNPDNWVGGVVPGPGDAAVIKRSAANCTITNGVAAEASYVKVGIWERSTSLIVQSGGSLTTGYVALNDRGEKASRASCYVINNGAISGDLRTRYYNNKVVNTGTLTGDVTLGAVATNHVDSWSYTTFTNSGAITATDFRLAKMADSVTDFDMEGGTVTATNLYMNEAGTGHINLKAGTIDVETLHLATNSPSVYQNYTIDVTEGVLIADGDNREEWDFLIDEGVFTTSLEGGGIEILTRYSAGRTTLEATAPAGTVVSIR